MDLTSIKQNQVLKPYYLDFVSKNLLWNFSDLFGVGYSEKVKIQNEFYNSLYNLSKRLKEHVPEENLMSTIEEVTSYYTSTGITKLGLVENE